MRVIFEFRPSGTPKFFIRHCFKIHYLKLYPSYIGHLVEYLKNFFFIAGEIEKAEVRYTC